MKLGEDAVETVPTSVNEAAVAARSGKIVIMGGLKPGMTTDTVAALVAQETNSDLLIKATDQDGVYNRDPRRHKDAKIVREITLHDLAKLLTKDRHEAGIHQIVDPVAIGILKNAGIKMIVLNGFDPQNVEQAIQGKDVGTTIKG